MSSSASGGNPLPSGPLDSPPPALALRHLDVAFGGDSAAGAPGLSGVNLDMAEGERLVLVGASGEGKSTLLRAIAGLIPIRGGEIQMRGVPIHHRPPEARNAVYLHQEPVLFPHLTVAENIAFPLRVRGVADTKRNVRVLELLEQVRLGGMERRLPHTLSGGQRHRVALARAVIAKPQLLLLDEPLTGLDPILRRDVRDTILALLEGPDAPALLMVTHDLEEAGWIGSRIGILIRGRLAQIAPPRTLFRAPETLEVARFLGHGVEIPSGWVHSAPEVPETAGVYFVMRYDLRVSDLDAPLDPGALEANGRVLEVRYPGPNPVLRVVLETPFTPASAKPHPPQHPWGQMTEGPSPHGPSPSVVHLVLSGRGVEGPGQRLKITFNPRAARFFPIPPHSP
jgi:ABC-type sugar transport system ATPase subunit